MHLRFWVYRRNLSNNPQSLFRSNEDIMHKAGCCISGFLGFLFLGLALMCLFSPQADKDGKLFLLFVGLFGIFEVICLIYSCIPWFRKYCSSYEDEGEEDECASNSLLSSEEDSSLEISNSQAIASYQACAAYSEIPSYQEFPSYQEISTYQVAPYSPEVGHFPGIANIRPLANYEGVFAHQQIPIYHQDLIEPQLPPYSSRYMHHNLSPQSDIHVY